MRLTKADILTLQEWGYPEEDIKQMKLCFKYLKLYKITENGNVKITQKEALNILGRECFLSGIARSAFHFTAIRGERDKQQVYFDCSSMFNRFLRSA